MITVRQIVPIYYGVNYVVEENNKVIAYCVSIEKANDVAEALRNYMPDVHGNPRCTNCCDGV